MGNKNTPGTSGSSSTAPWQGWDGGQRRRHGGHGGPPPWVQGLLGWGAPGATPSGPGPRAKRGDVRLAILSVIAEAARREEPINGYQVIQQIAERSDGAWRPSPGSVYPTIQQLQDEGLVETDDERGRKTLQLTTDGSAYVEAHTADLDAVWAPYERATQRATSGTSGDLKSEIGQMMSAVWQIVTQGSDAQRKAAIGVLVDTRRALYGILADGAAPTDDDDATTSMTSGALMEPRIGDAERDVATARLGDHFAAGRLDHEEYDERLDAIWSARTRADLDQVFWDLPVLAAPRPVPPAVRAALVATGGSRCGCWSVGAVLLVAALDVPWWVWLIGLVVLLKRPWARGRRMHGIHGHQGRAAAPARETLERTGGSSSEPGLRVAQEVVHVPIARCGVVRRARAGPARGLDLRRDPRADPRVRHQDLRLCLRRRDPGARRVEGGDGGRPTTSRRPPRQDPARGRARARTSRSSPTGRASWSATSAPRRAGRRGVPLSTRPGIRSMLGARLYTTRQVLGSLNLYSFEVDAFDSYDVDVAHLLARHAAVALESARGTEHLLKAVDARNLIGQAQGILMERYDPGRHRGLHRAPAPLPGHQPQAARRGAAAHRDPGSA